MVDAGPTLRLGERAWYTCGMRCPICKREFDQSASASMPFCSERCRTIDLGRWLGEAYRLPVKREEAVDEDADAGYATEGNGAYEE